MAISNNTPHFSLVDTGRTFLTSLIGESTLALGRQLAGRATKAIGESVYNYTPSIIYEPCRWLGRGLQESVGGVLGYVEDWTSHGFATKICAPIFEELVYRVGIQQALQYTLDSLMTTAGVPDSVASTVSKVASVHLTAYLFALSHGPVQTQEGALRYLRAIVRGSAFELANTPLNGFLGITLSHMAYNALR